MWKSENRFCPPIRPLYAITINLYWKFSPGILQEYTQYFFYHSLKSDFPPFSFKMDMSNFKNCLLIMAQVMNQFWTYFEKNIFKNTLAWISLKNTQKSANFRKFGKFSWKFTWRHSHLFTLITYKVCWKIVIAERFSIFLKFGIAVKKLINFFGKRIHWTVF